MQMLTSCKDSVLTVILLCVSKINDCFWKLPVHSPRSGKKLEVRLQIKSRWRYFQLCASVTRHIAYFCKKTLKLKKRHFSVANTVHSNALAEYSLSSSLKTLISLATLLTDGLPSLWSQTTARSLQLGENLVQNSCQEFMKLAVKNHLLQT